MRAASQQLSGRGPTDVDVAPYFKLIKNLIMIIMIPPCLPPKSNFLRNLS